MLLCQESAFIAFFRSNANFSYSNLQHELLAIVLGLESVQNGRQRLGIEFDVDDS
jgi:hypothetical protein